MRTFHDKVRSLRLAQALDVPTLPFGTALRHDELRPLAAHIGFPLAVRPLGGANRLCGRKSLICGSEQELRAFLPAWPAGADRLLLQRYAPGERHNIFFAAFQGEIVRAVQTRILRTDARDGTGLAVDGVTIAPSPQLRALCERLLGATRYTGIGNAQFIVDPRTGASCFLELNARVGGSQMVTEAIGMNLGVLAIELASAAERPVEGEPFRYAAGFRYAWLIGDLAGLKRALAAGEIGPREALRWLASSLGSQAVADVDQMWSWSDPLPGLMAVLARAPGRREPLVPGPRRALPERAGLGDDAG